MAKLTPEQIREYISDTDDSNHLIDGVEFSDARIGLAMILAVDSYNVAPPVKIVTDIDRLPANMLLTGTLWHLFNGQVALAARNQMSYSDGGLNIPIEERYQYYIQLSQSYEQQFKSLVKDHKISVNLENAWGEVRTDYATFPVW